MTTLKRITLTVFALNSLLSLPAQAADRGKEGAAPAVRAFPSLTRIYRFEGVVTTSLSSLTGVQASVHCTNWHPTATNQIRITLRDFNGATVATAGPFNLTSFRTFTYSTQFTNLFTEDSVVVPSSTLDQGSIQVDATLPAVHCQATGEDAASASASSVFVYQPTRNFPEGGTQE